MAIRQTQLMRGNARLPQPTIHKAGVPVTVHHTHTFNEAVNTTDILELFVLPAYAKLEILRINTENLGALNLSLGFMTGTPFSTLDTRTVGSTLFSAVAAGTEIQATAIALGNTAPTDADRSVGLVPSVSITPAANKRLHLFAQMSAG